jgi:quercetin dioxygenase-like cupin family protein
MRSCLVLTGAVALLITTALTGTALPQGTQLAPEGRGLLPEPAETAATLGGTRPSAPFEPDPFGGYSRTVFETDEDPNFKITIRDYSFPPDHRPHTLELPSAAFLHIIDGQAEFNVAGQHLAVEPGKRVAVAAGAPIELVNNGQIASVVRALIVEAK